MLHSHIHCPPEISGARATSPHKNTACPRELYNTWNTGLLTALVWTRPPAQINTANTHDKYNFISVICLDFFPPNI